MHWWGRGKYDCCILKKSSFKEEWLKIDLFALWQCMMLSFQYKLDLDMKDLLKKLHLEFFPKNLFSENHWTNLSQQTHHSKVDSLKRNAIEFLTTFMTQNYLFWSKRFSNMVLYNFVACCSEYRKYWFIEMWFELEILDLV